MAAEHPGQATRDEYAVLVREAAAGDDAAIHRLVEEAQQLARRFSLAVCGRTPDVDDAVQEALVKTFRFASRIEHPEGFRAWLYQTVKNACLIGRRRRAQEPSRFEALDGLVVPDGDRSPEDIAASNEEARHLRAALQRIPDSYREVVFLRDMEGLSTREAAVVLGTSEDNVKTRLRRARVQLKQALSA